MRYYGPAELGGANFRNLYTEQGLGIIQQIISNLRTSGQATQMLKIAISWAQYTSGMEVPIFKHPHNIIEAHGLMYTGLSSN